MLFIHGHQWRDIVNVNAMSSYSSSSESSGAGVLIRPIQVSDQARRELRESLEDGEMVGPFGHLVTVFFVFFCLDFCVGCGGKFLEASMRWERRRTDNWYLVSLSHFLIQIDALRCHARQAPKAQREREGVGDWDRTLLMWLYIETIFINFQCSVRLYLNWLWWIMMNRPFFDTSHTFDILSFRSMVWWWNVAMATWGSHWFASNTQYWSQETQEPSNKYKPRPPHGCCHVSAACHFSCEPVVFPSFSETLDCFALSRRFIKRTRFQCCFCRGI